MRTSPMVLTWRWRIPGLLISRLLMSGVLMLCCLQVDASAAARPLPAPHLGGDRQRAAPGRLVALGGPRKAIKPPKPAGPRNGLPITHSSNSEATVSAVSAAHPAATSTAAVKPPTATTVLLQSGRHAN